MNAAPVRESVISDTGGMKYLKKLFLRKRSDNKPAYQSSKADGPAKGHDFIFLIRDGHAKTIK
jgi:hypothetical protein